jgi:ABC-type transport system involved in cytochrome bd biosynthesis fused ATPase/permease subunit
VSYRFWSRAQVVALVALGAMVLVLAIFAFVTHSALCSFKGDLESRVAVSQAILDDNEGQEIIRAFGLEIPRDQAESQLANQRRTLESLNALYCW